MAEVVNQTQPTQPFDSPVTMQVLNSIVARVEERIDHNYRLAEIESEHLKELLETIRNEYDKALVLKAEENKVHFEKLNGEHHRIAEILNKTVQKEVYENNNRELRDIITTSKESILGALTQVQKHLEERLNVNSEDIRRLQDKDIKDLGKASVLSPTLKWVLGILGAVVGALILLAISNWIRLN